jgi:hypothetical protein
MYDRQNYIDDAFHVYRGMGRNIPRWAVGLLVDAACADMRRTPTWVRSLKSDASYSAVCKMLGTPIHGAPTPVGTFRFYRKVDAR